MTDAAGVERHQGGTQQPGMAEGGVDGARGKPPTMPASVRWDPVPIGLTKHEAAVRRSLAWADDAAAALDFKGALKWLAAIEATGDQLTSEYVEKQRAWTLAAQA